MNFREAVQRDVQDLHSLAEAIEKATSVSTHDFGRHLLAGCEAGDHNYQQQERELDLAAWRLREWWLRLAHRPADATPKTPSAGHAAHVAAGGEVDFGCERDLDASLLEGRRVDYMQTLPGWSSDLVLFRSGQAALAALLQYSVAEWGKDATLKISHCGAYFETRSLMEAWPTRVLELNSLAPALVVAEPVWCDGGFGLMSTHAASARALFLDTTLSGPGYDVSAVMSGTPRLVVAYSSGLKLDQAGLELANVGIVRIYSRDDACDVASRLRKLRSLNGTGLTLDELSALSAPWFMYRGYADSYTGRVFLNNRALAQVIGKESAIFEPDCHPSLLESRSNAPFCALRLREPTPDGYRRLLVRLTDEIDRRGLLASRGGSFGFRGHRYELIEPEIGKGHTFLRVAMGWRDGYSRKGLCELLEEIASLPAL